MRIGLVVAGGMDRSGRERVLPEMLDFIERVARRHELHVFVLQYYQQPCEYSLLGATIHDLGRVDHPRGLRMWRLAGRLRRAVERLGQFDVLHAYWGIPTGAVAVDVGGATATPTIVTLTTGELVALDDIQYGLQRRDRDRRIVDRILDRAWMVTVPTEYMRSLAGARAERVIVLPMGLRRDRFGPRAAGEGPPWRLLRVATINRVKDYPLLLDAFARILRAESGTYLDIVGEDVLGGAMQLLARERGITERVTFHGYQAMDRLAAFYARAHLHVVSSRHEAAGVTAVEAALAGVPTVGTAVGHLSDWAALDPPAAAVVRSHDPDILADAVIALLRDPARRQRLAHAARVWALAHDVDWTAAAFEDVYSRAAAEARRPPRRL